MLIRGAVLVAAMLSAACSPSGGGSSLPARLKPQQQGLVDYADCLRREGLELRGPRFSTSGLERWVDLEVGHGLDEVMAAGDACSGDLPELVTLPTEGPVADFIERAQAFVDCMREHSIENMPDPTATGLDLHRAGINTNSRAFIRAERACGYLMGAS